MNEEETDPREEPDDARQDAGDENAEEDDGADDDELPVLRYQDTLRVDNAHHAMSSDHITLVPCGDEPTSERANSAQAGQKAELDEYVPGSLRVYTEHAFEMFELRRLVKSFKLLLPPDQSDDYEDYLYERAFEAVRAGELGAVGGEPSVEARPIDYVLWLADHNRHRLRSKEWVRDVVKYFEILKKQEDAEGPSERVEPAVHVPGQTPPQEADKKLSSTDVAEELVLHWTKLGCLIDHDRLLHIARNQVSRACIGWQKGKEGLRSEGEGKARHIRKGDALAWVSTRTLPEGPRQRDSDDFTEREDDLPSYYDVK